MQRGGRAMPSAYWKEGACARETSVASPLGMLAKRWELESDKWAGLAPLEDHGSELVL